MARKQKTRSVKLPASTQTGMAEEISSSEKVQSHPQKVQHVASRMFSGIPKMYKTFLAVCLTIVLISAAAGGYYYIFKDLPDPRGLQNYGVIPLSSKIYDRNGKLLYEIYNEENRTPIKLSEVPKYVAESTLAIEDANFYNHGGISIFGGILRAAKDMVLGGTKQGGSTLTQQLVKSALLTPERTIRRKLREAVLAIQIEQLLTKDQILELYLSQVPYGGVSYGVQAASKAYFGKDAKELKLHEAALLAGLPAAPSAYNPYTNFEKAKERQISVLKRMKETGFITEKQREEAAKAELHFRPPRTEILAPHFVFYVRAILEKEYGKELVEQGGLKVVTTLDEDLQASAESMLRTEIQKVRSLRISNGAAVVTRPATGEILSMVGSADFFASPSGSFNVTTAHRQPGSSIKPINYAIGIDRKLVNPASVFNDGPTCFQNEGQPKAYCPGNYDGTFHGPVQLRFALAQSLNIPAVRMVAKVGVKDFIASAPAFMINSFKDPERYGLSITLGGGEVTMLEMVQAFSAFANEGVPKEVVSILKVTDKNGKLLYEYKDPNYVPSIWEPLQYPNFLNIQGKRAISKETAFLISHILMDDGARSGAFGTNSQLVVRGKTVSVKTGTTNDLRDNWTIGYTPNFLTAVWVGNNDNTSMSRVASGVTGASPIWNKVMTKLLEKQPDLSPRKPDGVVGRSVCSISGRIPSDDNTQEGGAGCPTRFEYMIAGTENIGAGVMTREQVFVNKNTSVPGKEGETDVEAQEKLVIWDGLSKYCLECVHENEPPVTVDVVQYLLSKSAPKVREIRREN